ncbi:MAG: transporter substrate-binding domain-containing protein [Rubrivivax sp.]|nr:transporter substrate-binding domain-containing protein [Rubrivivax sp.]
MQVSTPSGTALSSEFAHRRAAMSGSTESTTLARIRARGFLRAGVSQGIRGLSLQEHAGAPWQGFDVELAKALAIAVCGDVDAIEFVPTAPAQRFAAVAQGEVDVGTFNASATLGRELAHGIVFPQPMLFDGEAFLVRRADLLPGAAPGVAGLIERRVAIQNGATTRANLERWFRSAGLGFELVEHASPQAALQAYASGACNVYALDHIPLTGERLRLPDPVAHVILDEAVSKEAMGPVVVASDPVWVRAVTWVMRTLIEAEELGITRGACTHAVQPLSPHAPFLLPSPERCSRLGLIDRFPQRVIQGLGNYAEIFERTLGTASPLNLPRGRNALWRDGGLLISPSFD